MSTILYSCIYNEDIISQLSEIKYGDDSELIMANGFFTQADSGYISENGINTLYHNVIFYPEQTVSYFFLDADSLQLHDVHNSLQNCLVKWRKNNWGIQWGVYQKKGDRVCVDMYRKSLLFSISWDFMRDIYTLKGDTLIHDKRIAYNYDGKKLFETEMNIFYLFVPVNRIPPQSNHFLKKKKWIWKDSRDWEEYQKVR